MLNYILFIIGGMYLLIKGADSLVKGASSIAKWLKISPIIIGLTIVSIGTSLPELSVNIVASIDGLDDISIGNIIGSNIFDIYIVLGVSSLIAPLAINKEMKKYDIPILIFVNLILGLFIFVISPLVLSSIEGIILLVLMVLYTIFLVIRDKKKNIEVEIIEEEKYIWYKAIFAFILGLLLVIIGAKLVVEYSSLLAKSLGMSDLLISLTIISIGTSLPEIVTSIIATKNKEYDIAIGNGVGSCIYNMLLIIGLSAIINPISIDKDIIFDYCIMLFSSLCLIECLYFNRIRRSAGIVFIFIYALYMTYIVVRCYG